MMELNLPFSDPAPVVEEVEEPSVLEYARTQGICVDYTTDLPQIDDIRSALGHTIDWDLEDPFDDDFTNAVAGADELTKERLALSKESAIFLRSALVLQKLPDDCVFDVGVESSQQWIRDMKQELPVLQTDAELDMLSFGTRFVPDFKVLRTRIPSEELDEENDEGFGWPAKYFSYPGWYEAMLRDEKLAVTREGMVFLQDAVVDRFVPEDGARVMEEALERRRDPVPRHLTPPLLPLSPPITPYVPSSPADRLQLIPESSDSVLAELKALDEQIMAEDSLSRLHSGSSDSMLLEVEDIDALFDADEAGKVHSPEKIPKILKHTMEDLKVEGPLTPPMFSDSPMKKLKSVSFSDMFQVGNALELWSDEQHPGSSASQSITEELATALEPVVTEANRKIENEKLVGADTVSRIDVPPLDFTLLVAPWNEYSQRKNGTRHSGITELEAQTRFLRYVKHTDLKSAPSWHGVSDLDMRWGWFSSPHSTITLKESLHGETEFAKIQADLKAGDIATSSGEVWKREGLRILEEDEDDDDEEIDPAEFEEPKDVESLVRKRRLELEEEGGRTDAQDGRKHMVTAWPGSHNHCQSGEKGDESHISPNAPAQHDSFGYVHRTSINPDSQQSAAIVPQHKGTIEKKEVSTGLMFGGFSASMALHRFMESQGKAVSVARPDPQTQADCTGFVHVKPFETTKTPAAPNQLNIEKPVLTSEIPANVPQPIPPFDLPTSFFIISTALLKRRPLIKELERLHPNAELIYRDYTLSHSTYAEADLILSPSTGVLLTTLQQIKQAPLPGQIALSPVKERIAVLQLRYERLLLLVSEGLRDECDSRPEDARDRESLKELEGFAARLDGSVVVQYVAGGEQMLAKAVVENMTAFGFPCGGKEMRDVKLFAVETTWETLLRRAGLNPFAAQFIIASLKLPTVITCTLPSMAIQHSQDSPIAAAYTPEKTVVATGLAAFVLMEREERARLFRAVMGGRRVLDGVGALLDQRWVCAAYGFRM